MPTHQLCCPECQSDNVKVRLNTNGTADVVECRDCLFIDYAEGEKRIYPDQQQWVELKG
jgi:hypothetical protein